MRKPNGFTLIEVALFIALSGMILMGVIISTGNSINQQHYNDAVQNFSDFLRGIYSEVSDPKSAGDGRSDKAIYGKLVTFGEKNSDGEFYVYDIIGDAEGNLGSSDVLSALKSLGASPIIKSKNTDGISYTTSYAGFEESYTPTWGASVQLASADSLVSRGAILIVRSPMSGIIYTFTMTGETVEVKETVEDQNKNNSYNSNFTNPLTQYLSPSNNSQGAKFQNADIDFCIDMDNVTLFGDAMRDIRIGANAHNSSSVIAIDVSDTEGNRCKK